ncbi:GmrSD restriction endonuclease domain-containing protein [Arthrobacter rhombi]|uniref:GmrSD restriction endonuclease domain-containing protein n=1 Tax=Arthrobacter rhombi TaxID=71253 RepID=UPI003FD5C7E4
MKLSRFIATAALAGLALAGCGVDQPGAPTPASDVMAESSAASQRPTSSTTAPTSPEATKPESRTSAKPTSKSKPAKSAPKKPGHSVGPALKGPAALAVLDTITVKGKAPATGYDRGGQFGSGWKDPDGNSCDARQDILTRDMTNLKYKDSRHCLVASGTLADLYTGKTIHWSVGWNLVDIDHMVALKNVWISGGQKLSYEQRVAIANDPLNLFSSDASANRQKGDKNAAEWLPSNKPFRCQYVATQVSVKKKYSLAVTAPEKEAMQRVLGKCTNQRAAKFKPITPAGKGQQAHSKPTKKAPAKTPANNGKKPSTSKGSAAQVSPGTFCKGADAGKKGIGKKNGKTYTCKASSTDERLRWRQ